MGDVGIPNWLKGLPLAPEFRPTDTEFADPIAYISKIEKEASAFGICKIIPPLPKPSKKYVISNLNKSLSKCPELGSDVNLADGCSSLKTDSGNEANDGKFRAVFTTRHQELGQQAKTTKKAVQPLPPTGRKQVWQSGEVYTLEQFESKSKAFARSQLGAIKELSPLVIEKMFWKAALEKPIHVEYANDVPGSGFEEPEGTFQYFKKRRRRRRGTFFRNNGGSCDYQKYPADSTRYNRDNKMAATQTSTDSSTKTAIVSASLPTMLSNQTPQFSKQKSSAAAIDIEGTSGWKLSNSPWNLQVIARSPGSLTRFMLDDIPGVTSPMIYIGMLFSWFAWHVEDHELHSLNFLHTGSPKTWYAVPGDYAFAFEDVIRNQAYGGNIDRLAALSFLGEKTTLLSPSIVVESGIPCCRLIQNPGEFVVTFPRAYHVGFSHGFNCGEAANFGTSKWLEVAKGAAVRRAAMNYLPMLSHQQLLYLLTMSFVSRVPRSLLPGARSSRLRDRLKEERELAVKKACIEDILSENNLLTILLQKNPAYHVVLWNLELLPSPSKESELCSCDATILTTPTGGNASGNKNNQDLFSEMSLYLEFVNDLYGDDDYLSCDFQVDSGTLACVACGILGFPFMSVVQPSERASMKLLQDVGVSDPAELHSSPIIHDMGEGFVSDGLKDKSEWNEGNSIHHPNGARPNAKFIASMVHSSENVSTVPDHSPPKDLSSESEYDKGWSATKGFLRPRIFCLEHAIQIDELLHSKGGANVLVICHSDFPKMKAHAATIAEEIGRPFGYKEIPLDDASQKDLNLMDLAIDGEEHDECGEDWTSKLCINLRHCVKVRKNSSTQVQHALALGGLFSEATPSTKTFNLKRWPSRKSRSRRNSHSTPIKPSENIQMEIMKPSESIQMEKDEVSGTRSDGIMFRKDGKLIQYSRRSLKSKPGDSVAAKDTFGHPAKQVHDEVSVADRGSPDEHKENTVNNSSGIGASKGKSDLLLDSGVAGAIGDHNENSVPSRIADSILLAAPGVETLEVQMDSIFLEEINTKGLASDSDSTAGSVSKMQHEIKVGASIRKDEKLCAENFAGALFIDVESTENSEMQSENQIVEEISMPPAVNMSSSEGLSTIQSNGDVLPKVASDLNSAPLCSDDPVMDSFDDQREQSALEQEESRYVNVRNEKEPVLSDVAALDQSTAVSIEQSLEVSTKTNSDEEMQSGGENCYLPDKRELESTDLTMECPKSSARKGSKRRREVELQAEAQFDFSCFSRSPCEGLRSRAAKSAKTGGTKCNKLFKENQAVKRARKPSDGLLSLKEKKENRGGYHRCNIEGCRTSFHTKADLLLHKCNRCPEEGCGKKFRSHKYAILHQRVHDDDRPLKCPWKGCKMSFKWAWARTEHLRVHTGERPYQCQVEGCGLAFRFISDFSRHRRKLGHYLSSPN